MPPFAFAFAFAIKILIALIALITANVVMLVHTNHAAAAPHNPTTRAGTIVLGLDPTHTPPMLAGTPARSVLSASPDHASFRVDMRHTTMDPLVATLVQSLKGSRVQRLPYAIAIDVADVAQGYANAVLLHQMMPYVLWVEQDTPVPIQSRTQTTGLSVVPNDTLYEHQWALHSSSVTQPYNPDMHMHIEDAWQTTLGRNANDVPVRVAILDDGFLLTHPDLVDRYARTTGGAVEGYDVSRDPNDASSGQAFDDDPSASSANDVHGTQTAGLVAATGNNGRGISGVCPQCTIVPVRLFTEPVANAWYSSGITIAAGITWAVEHGAAVINNSWGPPDGAYDQPFHQPELWPIPTVVDEALRGAASTGRNGLGTVMVWAAGNGGESMAYDRFASHPTALAVGSLDATGVRAAYSDHGFPLVLMAPSGGRVPSQSGRTNPPGLYTTARAAQIYSVLGDQGEHYTTGFSGTSASSPLVAGAAALLIAAYPDLTAAQVAEALLLSARIVDASFGNYVLGRSPLYGYGTLDVRAAMQQAATYHSSCTFGLEICGNNRDDNCNNVVDAVEPTCTSTCLPESAGGTAASAGEACDDTDNNCDGRNNEAFACSATQRPICAPCSQSNQCAAGSTCINSPDFFGNWCFTPCTTTADCPANFHCATEPVIDVCVPDVRDTVRDCRDVAACDGTVDEICDGLDNNCDTLIDNISDTHANRLQANTACASTHTCTMYVGSCSNGTWHCITSSDYQSLETRCDGMDNDCDGEIDEAGGCGAGSGRTGCAGCNGGTSNTMLWTLMGAITIALMRWRSKRANGRNP